MDEEEDAMTSTFQVGSTILCGELWRKGWSSSWKLSTWRRFLISVECDAENTQDMIVREVSSISSFSFTHSTNVLSTCYML